MRHPCDLLCVNSAGGKGFALNENSTSWSGVQFNARQVAPEENGMIARAGVIRQEGRAGPLDAFHSPSRTLSHLLHFALPPLSNRSFPFGMIECHLTQRSLGRRGWMSDQRTDSDRAFICEPHKDQIPCTASLFHGVYPREHFGWSFYRGPGMANHLFQPGCGRDHRGETSGSHRSAVFRGFSFQHVRTGMRFAADHENRQACYRQIRLHH